MFAAKCRESGSVPDSVRGNRARTFATVRCSEASAQRKLTGSVHLVTFDSESESSCTMPENGTAVDRKSDIKRPEIFEAEVPLPSGELFPPL